MTVEELQELANQILQMLCDPNMRDLDDFLLPVKHHAVQVTWASGGCSPGSRVASLAPTGFEPWLF